MIFLIYFFNCLPQIHHFIISHRQMIFAFIATHLIMSIFSSIKNNNLNEIDKIKTRQAIIAKDLSSPFFTPLLFDPNMVGRKNCENLVGQVCIPVGIAGPVSTILIVGSIVAQVDNMLLPLATTEGALVASIGRGCKVLNASGNTKVVIKKVGMTRAPVFVCPTIKIATSLSDWLKNNLSALGKIGEQTSHHLIYLDCQIFQKDNLVFARFSFDTGEAMGMNMVTIATDAIVRSILSKYTNITCPALSSNVCSDKKTSALTRKLGRGRWVTITCNIPDDVTHTVLKTTPSDLLNTYQAKIVTGSRLAGLAGRNMHVANVAAAMLSATGQDIAHTVDISQGTLTLAKNHAGIYAKLSLPSVPVGTIGGGTSLTTQTTARNLITNQPVTSDILAAAIGLAALAGELSGLAALSTSTLASSHARLARVLK